MKYLFFVQSEGRGHLMQALTMQEKLEKRGHQVVAVITGNGQHGLPQFFIEEIKAPVFLIESPMFVLDKDGAGIRTVASLIDSLRRSPAFFRSLRKIARLTQEFQPDAFISFYEPLAGLYTRLYRDKRPLFCVAHQYFISHSACRFPKNSQAEQKFFKMFNSLNAPRHSTRIALSFTKEADTPEKRLFIVPPLIRSAITNSSAVTGDYLLIYLLNSGYKKQINAWSSKHPQVKIEAFTNSPDELNTTENQSLIWHQLSGKKFIDRLIACQAYVSTAGFDSISEAAFLGKNILMVPTKNHFEQECNAVDAHRAHLAIFAPEFNLDLIADNKKTHSDLSLKAYREWVLSSGDKIINILESSS